MTTRFEDIDPVAYAAWLSQRQVTDEHVVAARAAVEHAETRYERERALKEAAVAVAREGLARTDPYADAVARNRAQEVDGLSPGARAEDNAATRAAARWEARQDRGTPPPEREGYTRSAETEAALGMARRWMADRDLAERQRALYGGVENEDDDSRSEGRTHARAPEGGP